MGTQIEGRIVSNAALNSGFATPTAVPPTRHRSRTQINVTPSPKAVVSSGDFSYFSESGMSPLPYALSEFIDNSLAAINTRMTADSGASLAPNIIPGDIRISFDRVDKLNTVVIWDNGCGMDKDTLKDFAIYALSPEDRLAKMNATAKKPLKESSLTEFYSNPLRVNSNISMFGVGAKMSAFFIGNDLTMVTKCAQSEEVHEFRCNSVKMNSQYRDKGNECYNQSINNRAPGAVADSELAPEAALIPRLKSYIEVMEKQHNSFTYVVINGVKRDFITRFEKFHKEISLSLASVYHWYLHGHSSIKTPIGGNISISLAVNNFPVLDLKSVPSVIKEQLQRKKDTFSFEIVDSENGFGVFGFVNYFPFNDVETYPKESQILAQWCGTPEPDSDDEDDDSNVNNGLDPSEQSIHPIFSCWWQGRLIPITTVESFKWMGPSFKQTTSRCRYRVKGCLFLDKSFKVTQNKSTFTDDVRAILERQSATVQLVDNIRGPIAKLPRSSKTVEDAFKEWIKSCHDRYDKEVQLRTKRPKESHARWRSWLEYEEMVISGSDAKSQRVFKTGDIARINTASTKKLRFGRIIKFLRANPQSADDFETHPDAAFVSGSDRGLKCEVKALPDFCYPNPKDKVASVKLRMIDKTCSKDEVLSQLDEYTKKQLKHIPKKLDFDIYEPGSIPKKVSAGYKFPNVDVQILSCTGDSLTSVPFEPTKRLRSRQRFFVKEQGTLVELKSFDGTARDKKFSFWEIDTLFKQCGFYSCVFDIPNYISPLDDAILTKTYEFQVVPGLPTALKSSKQSSNPLTITLGAPSKGEVSVQFTDQFGNACIPDDIFLNNLVLSHDYLIVKPKPFKVVNGNVIIANIYTEPKTAEGGKFVTFRPNEIASLNIGVRGRPNGIGTISVNLTLGEPYSMVWADDCRPLRVTSGGSLPSLKMQLVDRYGLPAKPNPALKSLTIKLLDPDSKLNGVAGKPVQVSELSDPSGLILGPVIQINSGLDRVTLRASLSIRKAGVSVRTIDLDRLVIVQPGNMLGCVELSVANLTAEASSVIAGSTHSLQIDLFGENGQIWPKPYSEQICQRYELHYNGRSFPLTPLGVFPNVVTFPERIQNVNPFRICATVVDVSPDSVNIPLPCETQVTICPDRGVQWSATIMRPIRCGEPIGDAIQIKLLDVFNNPCKINPNLGIKVKFSGNLTVGGSTWARYDSTGTCMTYPGVTLIGHGPGYGVLLNDELLAKFGIVEGPPSSLVLNVSDETRSFQQILSEDVTNIDVPIVAYSMREFHVHAFDVSGSIVSFPPTVQVACNDARISPITAPHQYKKAFQLVFNVPARQSTVTVTFTCDQISKPMVCVFPVQPWLLGVSAINLDPVSPAISAGAPFPDISGHILNFAGDPVSMDINMLSSLSLAVRNTEGKDLGPELFAPAAVRDAGGGFIFRPQHPATMAGTYTIFVTYTEGRPEVLELLTSDQHRLLSNTSVIRINPGPAARLHVQGDSEEPSNSARPIPNRLIISVEDEFGNPVPYRFQQKDAAGLRLKFRDGHDKDHLTRPYLSVDASGNIVVQSLGPNPHKPLPKQTYELLFKVPDCNLKGCSLEFYYSPNAQDITEFRALVSREENLSDALSALQQELRLANQAASAVASRLNTCRDQYQAIVSKHFGMGKDVDIAKTLEGSRSQLCTLRAEIAISTKPASVGTSNHQKLQSMGNFIGIIGLLATCFSEEDCRLVSYALSNILCAPIFHTISPAESARMNMRHFALDVMPKDESSLSKHLSLANQYGRQWNSDPVPLFHLVHPHPNIQQELFHKIFSSLLRGNLACKTYADGMAFKQFCVKHRLNCGTIFTYDGRILKNNGELGGTVPLLSKLQKRIGIEPRQLRERLVECEKHIQDLEYLQRLVVEQRQLSEKQNADSDRISSIEQRILVTEKDLESVRQQIEKADPNPAGTTGRKRRRASFGGPTARGDGPAARRRR